jgi:hypothetical protein
MRTMRQKHLCNTEGAKDMNNEDEEFNRIEREADMRRKAVSAALNEHVMHMRANLTEYERGVIDGRQIQVQSSVDKAVNAMAQRKWVGLTYEDIVSLQKDLHDAKGEVVLPTTFALAIEAKLKEKNA